MTQQSVISWITPRSLAYLAIPVVLLAVSSLVTNGGGRSSVIGFTIAGVACIWLILGIWSLSKKTVLVRNGEMLSVRFTGKSNRLVIDVSDARFYIQEGARYDTANTGIRRSGWSFVVAVSHYQSQDKRTVLTPGYANYATARRKAVSICKDLGIDPGSILA